MKRYKRLFENKDIEIYDAFKTNNAPFVEILDQYGRERKVPAPEAYQDFMNKSDITGRKIRWTAIKNGKMMSMFSAFNIKSSPSIKSTWFKLFDKMNKDELQSFLSNYNFSKHKDYKEWIRYIGTVNKVDKNDLPYTFAFNYKGKNNVNQMFYDTGEKYYKK